MFVKADIVINVHLVGRQGSTAAAGKKGRHTAVIKPARHYSAWIYGADGHVGTLALAAR